MSSVLIGSNVLKTIPRYGKHKVPRFIYHLTNKANYESMLKDGVIKTSKDGLFGNGIFAAELTNFFKRWRTGKSWPWGSLQKQLVDQVAKDSDDIVILKIPTKKLNQDLLKVRSQNTLFGWCSSKDSMGIFNSVQDEMHSIPKDEQGWADKTIEILKKHLLQKNKKLANHLTEGAPAKDSHLFTQRKEALEYIYREEIPIAEVEKIGEVNLTKLRESAEYDSTKPIRSIFMMLLKGTPEVKGAELLNC